MSTVSETADKKWTTRWHRMYWVSAWLAIVLIYCILRYWARWQINSEKYALLKIGLASFALAIVTGLIVKAILKLVRAQQTKQLVFSHIMVVGMMVITVALTRFTVSFFIEPWPQRDLRPVALLDPQQFNSWGMRDQQRTVKKKPGTYRIVFVGDSFLEGGFCKAALPKLCQQRLQHGEANVECVNLGVSATSPIHYYYRLKNVAQHLSPDAVCLVIYAGNDFLSPAEAFSPYHESIFTNLVAESPKPSLLGALLPELNWLVVNRFKMSEHSSGTTSNTVDEEAILKEISQMPSSQAIPRLAEYMHRYYLSDVDPRQIEKILNRGGPEFWSVFLKDHGNEEVLQAWWVHGILQWELQDTPYAKSVADTQEYQVGPYAAATQSWIMAVKECCDSANVPLVVVLAPVGCIDPEFTNYYEKYPRYYSLNYYCDARYEALKKGLEKERINLVDLKDVLQGVAGTYRKSDAHWNEKGHETVADYLVPNMKKYLR